MNNLIVNFIGVFVFSTVLKANGVGAMNALFLSMGAFLLVNALAYEPVKEQDKKENDDDF